MANKKELKHTVRLVLREFAEQYAQDQRFQLDEESKRGRRRYWSVLRMWHSLTVAQLGSWQTQCSLFP